MGKFTKFFTTTLWASSRRPFVRCEACRAQLAAQQQSTAPQPASPEQEQTTETRPSSLAQLAAKPQSPATQTASQHVSQQHPNQAQQQSQPASQHSSQHNKKGTATQPDSTCKKKNSDTARPPAQLKVHPRKGDTNRIPHVNNHADSRAQTTASRTETSDTCKS